MKKKLMIGLIAGAVFLGGASFVSAAEDGFTPKNENGNGLWNFGQMKPHMEQMHPELSTPELKEMYENCHGDGAVTNTQQTMMMNKF